MGQKPRLKGAALGGVEIPLLAVLIPYSLFPIPFNYFLPLNYELQINYDLW